MAYPTPLGAQPTLVEIKNYLAEAGLSTAFANSKAADAAQYTQFVTVEGIESHTSFAPGRVSAHWWIDYTEATDVLTFRVAYFNTDGTPTTYEVYAAAHPAPNPVTLYPAECLITWVNTGGNTYTATQGTTSPYATYIANRMNPIVKVS